MRRPRFLPPVILALVWAAVATAQTTGDFFSLQRRIIELFEENLGAMVRVKAVYDADPTVEDDLPQVVIGTGFFISREGLILTNASIVFAPVRVWVEHNNIAYAADLIGADTTSNLALLRVRTLPKQFNFLHLADQPDLPRVGTFILRLSMPLEFSPTPEMGLVTGFESRFGERIFPCVYIRTSIPAGPGDGGSAYLDLNGRLLGIQVGSLPDVGSTYILPSRAALRIREDLFNAGAVTYGWAGFEIREESSIEAGRQVLLSEVFADAPAALAGLQPGDRLDQVGDYVIRGLDDLRNAMFHARVGQYIEMRVLRDGARHKFNVRVAARPQDEPLQVVTPQAPPPEPVQPLKSAPPDGE
jgi:S1-C subfamily serine protease